VTVHGWGIPLAAQGCGELGGALVGEEQAGASDLQRGEHPQALGDLHLPGR